MSKILFPTIDLTATGKNIVRLRKERGLSVHDVQQFFGFEEPQAVYKWQQGKSLPTVDNLFALSFLFGVSMNEILVKKEIQQQNNTSMKNGQSFDCLSYFLFYTSGRFSNNRIIKRQISRPPKRLAQSSEKQLLHYTYFHNNMYIIYSLTKCFWK